MEYANEKRHLLEDAAAILKTRPEEVPAHLEKLLEQQKEMQAELDRIHEIEARADAQKLVMMATNIDGVNFVHGRAKAKDMEELRSLSDKVCDKLETGVVALAALSEDGKVLLVVKADAAAVSRGIHAGKIIKEAAGLVGGGGGGRPEMAQAGGKNIDGVPKYFEKVLEIIKAQLG